MPVMPRPSKAKAISDKVMKNTSPERSPKMQDRKQNGENRFERDVRTMIKR